MIKTYQIGIGLIVVAGLMFSMASSLALIAEHQETTSLAAKLIGFWGLPLAVSGFVTLIWSAEK